MKNLSLLVMAISFIVIGFIGILVSTWFASNHMSKGRAFPMMDMMMDEGMMNQQQMKDMMKSMMPGMLPPGIKSENLPEWNSQGAKLLIRYCTQCHELPNPSMHSSEEWPAITRRMYARMSMMSGMQGMGMMNMESPSTKEQETIVDYLKKHSLKSIPPGELPSPGSQGATLFRERCFQCHSLPDPKNHTAEEWPGIVERMRSNMNSMGRPVITAEEKNEIVAYLASHARK